MLKRIMKVEVQSRLNYFKEIRKGKIILYLFLSLFILSLIFPSVLIFLNIFLINS